MTKPFLHKQSFYVVALLAEGVDRNSQQDTSRSLAGVALLAEGVDRNNPTLKIEGLLLKSPSSRRAWIEISVRQDVQGRPVRRPPRGGRG